ncbi:uncharacterized protein MELLADRAFT_69175 [Melampsora larici-populina 98AG31]|uniref:Uncharacterized protein n=1 Tax=Melampsora larici-populina (strain 98AG31 / pathotype 3-4-7) TaxID=747676 RepID=F4S9P1_MELLP|nr:uncharacterized protein MELLADRAFT_69175 [Melampsora larici-populina 98AG31]EGF98636.1 hypothetical protein MELLADRAFT_69175 [Melampsora larici-populina 98AG31]
MPSLLGYQTTSTQTGLINLESCDEEDMLNSCDEEDMLESCDDEDMNKNSESDIDPYDIDGFSQSTFDSQSGGEVDPHVLNMNELSGTSESDLDEATGFEDESDWTWLSSWVSLMPIMGGIWDIAKPVPVTRSNCELCRANTMLVAYFWMAIPGFAFAFLGEVLRIRWDISRITRIEKRTSSASTLIEVPCGKEKRHKKLVYWHRIFTEALMVANQLVLLEYFLVAIPLLTSLPAPFMTA